MRTFFTKRRIIAASSALTTLFVVLSLFGSSAGARMLWGNSDIMLDNVQMAYSSVGVFAATDTTASNDRMVVLESQPNVDEPRATFEFTVPSLRYKRVAEFGIRAKPAAKCGDAWPRVSVYIDRPGDGHGYIRQKEDPVVGPNAQGELVYRQFAFNMNDPIPGMPTDPNSSTSSYPVPASYVPRLSVQWPAGTYKARVYLQNPYRSASCGASNGMRKVYLDWFGIRPTTTTKPSGDGDGIYATKDLSDKWAEDDWALGMFSSTATGAEMSSYSVNRQIPVYYKFRPKKAGVSVKGEECNGVLPRFRVYVDGVMQRSRTGETVFTAPDRSTYYKTFEFYNPDGWSWGTLTSVAYHTIRVQYLNPERGPTCEGVLHVNWVGMGA